MNRKLIAFSLPLVVAACSSLSAPTRSVDVPDRLKPQATESLAMIVPAKGVQIYECRAKADQAGGYAWAFVAPEADLFDAKGRRIGTHYAGPHWESADGSKIVGRVKTSAAAPRAEDIPWLLLTTKSVSTQGVFSATTSIQRVNTVGGIAPSNGCSQASVGSTVRMPYTADYYFLTEK
jgi:Protein of unknown function (DUF3455)